MSRGTKGFTLVELVVAGVLITGLCVAALPLIHPKNFNPQKQAAERWLGVAELAQGLKNYARVNGKLPAGMTDKPQNVGSEDGAYNLCVALVPHYLTDIPLDPYGTKLTANCLDSKTFYVSGFTVATAGSDSFTVAAPQSPKDTPISLTITYR